MKVFFALITAVIASKTIVDDFADLQRAVEAQANCHWRTYGTLLSQLQSLLPTISSDEMRTAKRGLWGYLHGMLLSPPPAMSEEVKGVMREALCRLANPAMKKEEVVAIFMRIYRAMIADASQLELVDEFIGIMIANKAIECVYELVNKEQSLLMDRLNGINMSSPESEESVKVLHRRRY